jgi:hypothetical protein
MVSRKFNFEEFLRELCDHLEYRFPDLRKSLEDTRSTDVIQSLARALTTVIPPLQRVLTFSMWMSRQFLREVAGITDEELAAIKKKVRPTRIWFSMTVEQWNTHTVIIDNQSGRQKTIYEPKPWIDIKTYIIWHHWFGETVKGPSKDGCLEVVFHENAIKCWARHGRFKGRFWNDESEEKYLFIKIPLKEEELCKFLIIPNDDDSVDPDGVDHRYERPSWEKDYHYEDVPHPTANPATQAIQVPTGLIDESGKPILKSEENDIPEESGTGWSLHILDNVARAIAEYF